MLLKEPELSLHPKALGDLFQMLTELQGHARKQIIVSTHAPDFLKNTNIKLNEVFLLLPGKKETIIKPTYNMHDARNLLTGRLLPSDIMEYLSKKGGKD